MQIVCRLGNFVKLRYVLFFENKENVKLYKLFFDDKRFQLKLKAFFAQFSAD